MQGPGGGKERSERRARAAAAGRDQPSCAVAPAGRGASSRRRRRAGRRSGPGARKRSGSRSRPSRRSRQRTLDGLKQQLMQAQLTLTAMHPTVVALQQRVDDFSQPSPELARLKAEERAIVMQIAPVDASADAGRPAGPTAARATAPDAAVAGRRRAAQDAVSEREDPSLAAPRERLSRPSRRYQDVMARIDSAQAAARHLAHGLPIPVPGHHAGRSRQPPEEAHRAHRRDRLRARRAALRPAGGARSRTGRRGVILETWQVRRVLKLEVLSELDPPL